MRYAKTTAALVTALAVMAMLPAAHAQPAPAWDLARVGPAVETALPGHELTQPLRAQATHDGKPDAGAVVDFVLTSGHFAAGSEPDVASAVTNAAGIATSPPVTTGRAAGIATAVLSADPGLPEVAWRIGPPVRPLPVKMAVVGPRTQAAPPGRLFPAPLEVRVTRSGHPVAGVEVYFALPPKGALFILPSGLAADATATSSRTGIASSPPVIAVPPIGRFAVFASTGPHTLDSPGGPLLAGTAPRWQLEVMG